MSGYNGPVSFPRNVPVDYSNAAATSDPLLQALKARYAEDMAAAQQVVQDEVGKPGYDFVMGSVGQNMAKTRRGLLRQEAAKRYNAGLPVNATSGEMKDIGSNPFYG